MIQVEHALETIAAIREDGFCSEMADKTEELISSSNESLSWVESEIQTLSSKVKFASGYQKQVDGATGVLREHLVDLIPDLVKLLSLKQVDIQNLSQEDALMFLSLKRIELIYSEMQDMEAEKTAQLESLLKKKTEEMLREVNDDVNRAVQVCVSLLSPCHPLLALFLKINDWAGFST